jgi:hypothetical protein
VTGVVPGEIPGLVDGEIPGLGINVAGVNVHV